MKKLMSALAILLAMMCASPGAMAQPSCKDGMGILFFQQARPIDVSRCLKAGADVNARVEGSAPLHWAVLFAKSTSVVRVLLKAGADVNARGNVSHIVGDDEGLSPLHLGFSCGRGREYTEEIVKVLLAAGADVNARSKKERTPLHLAAECSDTTPEVLNALLKAGADVNARDWAKSTPLHLALTRISRREIAPILLEAGADGNARDDWGKTPFEIIRRLINDLGWEWPKKYLEQSERK